MPGNEPNTNSNDNFMSQMLQTARDFNRPTANQQQSGTAFINSVLRTSNRPNTRRQRSRNSQNNNNQN